MADYSITDDSGFLALVDPDAYESFVAAEWDFLLLDAHFRAQMRKRSLLIWRTGMGNIWDVQVSDVDAGTLGLREVVGPIVSTRGRLLLTSFDSLSMAAQFQDVLLPEPHERDQLLALPAGEYISRIIQRYDPDPDAEVSDDYIGPDFLIELTPSRSTMVPAWTEIPWLEASWLEDS